MNIEHKEARLREIVKELQSVAVAFSAGTDSTYLLAICCQILGTDNVLAVTARSPTLPDQELQEARTLASHIGVRLEIVTTYEIENPEYVSNDMNRCYHCQDERFTAIWHVAQENGMKTVAYGATVDDLGDFRPGMRAAHLHNVRMPLIEARIGKADIRILSERHNLPTHNKPSTPCLASRIPYGKPISVENLEQVAEAEMFLKRDMGLHNVRVRHHDSVARLEVDDDDIERIVKPDVREKIVSHLRGLGFLYIAVDLSGFRSGNMNEGLNLL